MKTLRYIIMLAVVCSFTVSCMDGDWDTPEKTAEEVNIGNNAIAETNVVTIAALKDKYKRAIETDYRDGQAYAQVTEDMQIKAVVTGNDVQGNLYNEISVDDGTGAIIISISQGGIYGQLPVGAEILVDLKDLYVGNYGKQATIGTPYTNDKGTSVSRMNRNLWAEHFKLTGETKTVEPAAYATMGTAGRNGTQNGGKLVTLKNVSFKGADGKETYANAGGGAGSKSVYFNEYPTSQVMLYTSNFAKFAGNALPTGKVNVTGIMKRFNNSWEIIVRTLDDVEEVK